MIFYFCFGNGLKDNDPERIVDGKLKIESGKSKKGNGIQCINYEYDCPGSNTCVTICENPT